MRADSLEGGEDIPKLTFNDKVYQVKSGESLLALARRHGAHVWFVCDGRGLCRTCECQVLAGKESLGPPNDDEIAAISGSRREEGYRLACQARVTGPEDVKVVSVAEQLRRQAVRLVRLERGAESVSGFSDLMVDLIGVGSEFVRSLPHVARNLVPRIIDSPPSVSGATDYLRDAERMFEKVLGNPLSKK